MLDHLFGTGEEGKKALFPFNWKHELNKMLPSGKKWDQDVEVVRDSALICIFSVVKKYGHKMLF